MVRRRAWIREKSHPIPGAGWHDGVGADSEATLDAEAEETAPEMSPAPEPEPEPKNERSSVAELSGVSDEGFYSCDALTSMEGAGGAQDQFLESELKRALLASQHGRSVHPRPPPGM
eukprot:TRINITY_DN8807_c0_g1_i1.p2 TRINITY_DN8807_c0_g1~~TRINITY_DN8807_c0_g1_i1.p2  ORF type:complete len:117 (-),score=24.63 TRINITY_DN8807_c0_g1_i1:233-583(-)